MISHKNISNLKIPQQTLFWNGSFSLTSLSMGDWLEKMIHFIKILPLKTL